MDIDHVFICTSLGAPAAEKLVAAGFREGPPNVHPGQGTACRRFFFRNMFLELVWVADEREIHRDEMTVRTRLAERFAGVVAGNASPFGIILRPKMPGDIPAAPFEHWEYRPALMPNLVLWIASGTMITEPMWCVMPDRRWRESDDCNALELTGIRITSPPLYALDPRGFAGGVIDWRDGHEHFIELEFDGRAAGKSLDMRPDLPLMLHW